VSKLRVQSFAIFIDGYGAGPNQDLQNPLGVRGPELMEWFFHTRVWRRMHGYDDGETGVDNGIAEQGFAGIGISVALRAPSIPWTAFTCSIIMIVLLPALYSNLP
jgi:hypothetical protein